MNHVRKANLPEKVVADLKLDEMTEVFWSDEKNKYVDQNGNTMFAMALTGLHTITIEYNSEVRKGDHYLIQDDPYSVEPTGVRRVSAIQRPASATHYLLGPMKHESVVKGSGRNKYGIYEDSFPIVFLRPYPTD